jgi:hypothetical protein
MYQAVYTITQRHHGRELASCSSPLFTGTL